MKQLINLGFLTLCLAYAVQVDAGTPCTYTEAVLALERGNETRGLGLMHIAAADGDPRARAYLAEDHSARKATTLAHARARPPAVATGDTARP